MPSLDLPNESRLEHPRQGTKRSDASTVQFLNQELAQVAATIAPELPSVKHSGEKNSGYTPNNRSLVMQKVNGELTKWARAQIGEALSSQGFFVFERTLPSRQWFGDLYKEYDRVLETVENDISLLHDLDQKIEEWQSVNNNKEYLCHAPPTIRNRALRSDKEDKTYFQYNSGFYGSVIFEKTAISRIPSMINLIKGMAELERKSKEMFHDSFEALEEENHGISQLVKGDGRFPPIVIKLIRYPVRPKRFSEGNAHVDKSALTLILNSDDKETLLRVAPYNQAGISRSSFLRAVDYPASDFEANDATLISGLCLQEAGIRSIPPTPHYVMPIEEPRARHSVVAFHLVPWMDTELFSTKVPFIENGSVEVVTRRD